MKTKKILYTASIVLAVIVTTSINNTETKAGIFGKYGKLVLEMEGTGTIVYDCNYSLKSDCRRADW
ncbi:MAG: hypothetical protein JNK18_03685 [Cyclobacteriaceae bacterium]|nr:hypothetical protein [Cyclobacteriaceae bacterium]